MRQDTQVRKKVTAHFDKVLGMSAPDAVSRVIADGKSALDTLAHSLGKQLAEALMFLEREQRAGPDYAPSSSDLAKWGA